MEVMIAMFLFFIALAIAFAYLQLTGGQNTGVTGAISGLINALKNFGG